MPPRLPRLGTNLSKLSRLSIASQTEQICPICSLSRTSRPTTSTKTRQTRPRIGSRWQSGSASIVENPSRTSPKSPRTELHNALLDLQKDAANYINISKLQLALRSLEQTPGEETIRIAILGLAPQSGSRETTLRKAKELLRLLLADPLKAEEEWERILLAEQPGNKPILIRVGSNAGEEGGYSSQMVQELWVSSPVMNGHKLEILLGQVDARQSWEGALDELLVPTMEIPTSSTGRYTPITTPVHRSLLVGHGIAGASAMFVVPGVEGGIVGKAVDVQSQSSEELPFTCIDISQGTAALVSFRQSVSNALDYEHKWFGSNIPILLEWLKASNSSQNGELKPAIQDLIQTLIDNTSLNLASEADRRQELYLSKPIFSHAPARLQTQLNQWAEAAHTELRDQLDIAFHGRRWRKLSWWKLFWRVDDVSMIATDILHQRFLIEAEKELIFLAGHVEASGIFDDIPSEEGGHWAYKPEVQERKEHRFGEEPPKVRIGDLLEKSDEYKGEMPVQSWPLNIPLTRSFLATDTVPALQALAQKLVLQTLTTSSFVSAFAALTYVSTLSTGLYEAGAVAAVGIVWSLRRMQGKWETARKFWEGEVREEGRRAVRTTEGIVSAVLQPPAREPPVDLEFEKARLAVMKAEEKLLSLKYPEGKGSE